LSQPSTNVDSFRTLIMINLSRFSIWAYSPQVNSSRLIKISYS